MSGTPDRKLDADEAIRLVSVNADAWLKTSSTARSVLGAEDPWQKPDRAGNPDVCARKSNSSSVVKSTGASLCNSSTPMSVGDKMPIKPQSKSSTSVTAATTESPTVSVTGSCESSMPSSTPGCSSPLLTQSALPNSAVKSHNVYKIADVCDDPVTNKPTATMHIPPSATSRQLLCKELLATEPGQPELLEKNFDLNESDAVSSRLSQTAPSECRSDDCVTNVVAVSNDCSEPCDGNLSPPSQHLLSHSSEGTSYHTDQMEDKNVNDETSTSDPLRKIIVAYGNDVENDQLAELAVEPAQKNRQQNVPVQKSAVHRNNTGERVSRKPSRIVSFTTEDFDLFQSKCIAICNLAVSFLHPFSLFTLNILDTLFSPVTWYVIIQKL